VSTIAAATGHGLPAGRWSCVSLPGPAQGQYLQVVPELAREGGHGPLQMLDDLVRLGATGRGLYLMHSVMDSVAIDCTHGTSVSMRRRLTRRQTA
jgi:hypothetical protein